MVGIEIVFEDGDFLVVNKPAGLAVQGGEGVKTALVDVLQQQLAYRPFLVHRLDKDTSGLLLVAKHRQAATAAAALLAADGTRKIYAAVCAEPFDRSSGEIAETIMIRGRPLAALTRYKVVWQDLNTAVVLLRLGTGRMHQIRRHLAGQGHPLFGDDKYGDFSLNKRLKKNDGLKRLLLSAVWLEMPGRFRAFKAPPECFDRYLASPSGGESWRETLVDICRTWV